MIGEGGDPVVVQSSIALLRERFKQLQRMKEMRQERQLLKLLTAAATAAVAVDDRDFGPPTPPRHHEPTSLLGLSCQTELSLSLWPIQPHSRRSDAVSSPKSCWLVDKEKQMETPFFFVEPSNYNVDEVDTSLHL
ncbi:hypothetical protein MLD38_027738 [Melastoma candidum]|uniref:Uncharacterized protein n=1 Tax=Melastoma candidum TaxID=119954 RepID=A0ACB9P5S0_9MYRT|nr:hypothetical protein MLD38_027738 [Melastoma candidum]